VGSTNYTTSKDVTKRQQESSPPKALETAQAEETGKTIFLHTGRSNCK